MSKRIYNDVIYGLVELDLNDPAEGLVDALVQCFEFQRLRYIKQLGTAYLVFPSANNTRFEHSLGAFNMVRRMYSVLVKKMLSNSNKTVTELDKVAIYAAALLHDVGHGPFSHSFEQVSGTDHELFTQEIILDKGTEVNKVLRNFHFQLPGRVVQLIKGTHQHKWMCELISSEMDCDRLDYLQRDVYYCGVTSIKFDADILVNSLEVDLETDRIVISDIKGVYEAEKFIHSGYSLFKHILFHPKNLVFDFLLKKILKTSKKYDKLDTLASFLQLTDVDILFMIKNWSNLGSELGQLSRKFINREVPKLKEVKKEGDIIIPTKPNRFYNPNRQGNKAIYVKIDGKVKELSKVSEIVASFAQTGEFDRYEVLL